MHPALFGVAMRRVCTALALLAAAVSAAAPAAAVPSLEQGLNGTFAAPQTCSWTIGNTNASKAHWREGDVVPARLVLPALAAGIHTATVQWRSTTGGLRACDYATTFNLTETPDPCSGVPGCTAGTWSAFAVPMDPNLPWVPPAGEFRCYGCSISNVSTPMLVFGTDLSTTVTVVFTATGTNPVLAWGVHIAHPADWGFITARDMPGSPYHVELVAVDGVGSGQDRSIAADAVIGPPPISSAVSASSVAAGQSVTDQATLPSDAHGTLRFFACGPSGTAGGCISGGVQVGADVSFGGGGAVSAAFRPDSVQAASGWYCFRVEYTPDAATMGVYTSFAHTNTTTECFQRSDLVGVGAPGHAELAVVSPNPTRQPVRIVCGRGTGAGTVEIVDAGGRVVRRLWLAPGADGALSTRWDLHDARGSAVSSGVYLVRVVRAGDAPPLLTRVTVVR